MTHPVPVPAIRTLTLAPEQPAPLKEVPTRVAVPNADVDAVLKRLGGDAVKAAVMVSPPGIAVIQATPPPGQTLAAAEEARGQKVFLVLEDEGKETQRVLIDEVSVVLKHGTKAAALKKWLKNHPQLELVRTSTFVGGMVVMRVPGTDPMRTLAAVEALRSDPEVEEAHPVVLTVPRRWSR